jgi:septum formation protein
MSTPRLILASSSPRRRELLAQMGFSFAVRAPSIDESVLPNEPPESYVLRLARGKAQAGFLPGCISIGADTSVVLGREIMGKPLGAADGMAMLERLSGKAHQVMTAVAVYDGLRCESCVVASTVYFRKIEAPEIRRYWQTGEPLDKAGGYGIQEIGGIFAHRLDGSYSAVVGLPVEQTERLLQLVGFDTWSARSNGRRTPD